MVGWRVSIKGFVIKTHHLHSLSPSFELLTCVLLPFTVQSSVTEDLLKVHLVLSECARFVSEHKRDLTKILVYRSAVSRCETLVRGRISPRILSQNLTLKQLNHLHGDHERNGYKVSHHQPPTEHGDPERATGDIPHKAGVTTLQQHVQKSYDQGDY